MTILVIMIPAETCVLAVVIMNLAESCVLAL